MSTDPELLKKLTDYCAKRESVVLAYLFGSWAKGTASSKRSDYDFAVYFKPKSGVFEYEESEYDEVDRSYPEEDEIRDDLEKITGKDVDLVVLNRAPAYLVASILKTGIMLKETDRDIFLELWSRSLSDEEDYSLFFKDYMEIMERSHSLSKQDEIRLLKIITFLRSELELLKKYGAIDQATYMQVDDKRKVLERNIENIVNAGLDIVKIVLASHKKSVPNKYTEMMLALSQINDFDYRIAKDLADTAHLRNFIAHEYLDYRYKKIRKFVDKAPHDFAYLLKFTEQILKEA